MCVPTVTDEAVSQPQPCPPNPQQDWCNVQGPLHFWPPEKKGLPVGCGLAEKGEPSGWTHARPAAALLAAGLQAGCGGKGAIGDCGGSSRSPGSKPVEGRL